MNKLKPDMQATVIGALVEGASLPDGKDRRADQLAPFPRVRPGSCSLRLWSGNCP